MMVVAGVLYPGGHLVSPFGSEPKGAIAYHIRVPMLKHAITTATVEFRSAKRITHHTGPHTRLATTTAGSSDELGRDPILLVPQPIIIAQVTRTRKIPSRMIEPITALEMFLVGFAVSSASGAAPSQPVNAWSEQTPASANPAIPPSLGMRARLYDRKCMA